MKRFIEGENRFQSTLFLESLEDYIAEDNSIRPRHTLWPHLLWPPQN